MKRVLSKWFFSILICSNCLACIAQPVIPSQKTIGGNNWDFLRSLQVTKDGGIIAGGTSNSNISGEKTENVRGPYGNYDYWIVKLDKLHNIQWDKTIGGSGGADFETVKQTSDGGYVLCGASGSDSSYEKTENSRGANDYWIVKLDSSGNIQWDKTIGGGRPDHPYDIEQTFDGGYIVGGVSPSDISGEKTEECRGSYDYWIVKLDSSGNFQWDKTIGGNNWDQLTSVHMTNDGGYILGGYSNSNLSGEKTEESRGEFDYWIVKLDSSRNVVWDKTIGGNVNDALSLLELTSDGGYILGGYSDSDSSGEKSQNCRGSVDYWILKLDSSRNVVWDKTMGDDGFDRLTCLKQTSDGGYILGGYSTSDSSQDKTENSRGGTDYWIVKLDSLHNIEWDKTIGGRNQDYCWSIDVIKDNYYVTGGSSLSKISGDKKDTSRGGWDYWVVYLNYNHILPVNIINLRAYQQNDMIKIDWTSAAEINVDHYEIERCSDAVNFFAIGSLKSAGWDKSKNYSFYDTQPLTGDNYYRIKVFDKDGKITYSNTILATFIKNIGFEVYPSPAKDILNIQTNNKEVISILNQSGKTLLTKTINGTEKINISNLSAGVYYIKNNATGAMCKIIVE